MIVNYYHIASSVLLGCFRVEQYNIGYMTYIYLPLNVLFPIFLRDEDKKSFDIQL